LRFKDTAKEIAAGRKMAGASEIIMRSKFDLV
jgi:hypothetical protein